MIPRTGFSYLGHAKIPAYFLRERLLCLGGKRMFSVKELPWCAPANSPNRRPIQKSDANDKVIEEPSYPKPVDQFGIVAAMSRNRVIGVDGKLPWSVPEDRKLFTSLTRDKVLIVGRRTFEERPNQSHVRHVRHCIIVSSTQYPDDIPPGKFVLARSFQEALGIARSLANEVDGNGNIDCWIGGGQTIYEQALAHESASELHLSVIDTQVDVPSDTVAERDTPLTVAMFPAKYRWDNKFSEVSHAEHSQFVYTVYKRNKR